MEIIRLYEYNSKETFKLKVISKNKILSSSRQPQYYRTNLYFHRNQNKDYYKQFQILKLFMRNNQGQILRCEWDWSFTYTRNERTISLIPKKYNIDSNVDRNNNRRHPNTGKNLTL